MPKKTIGIRICKIAQTKKPRKPRTPKKSKASEALLETIFIRDLNAMPTNVILPKLVQKKASYKKKCALVRITLDHNKIALCTKIWAHLKHIEK